MLRGSGAVLAAGVFGAALAGPAAAVAAKPAARTGAVEAITQQTALFTGSVDGNGRATTFYFQYGPTREYGAQTNPTPTANPRARVRVEAGVEGLQPFTLYHYRVVAYNRDGQVEGRDRTFRTERVPLGLSLAASPNPVIAGRPTTLAGTLSGSENAGRRIRLQANPYPYLTGFNPVGNEVVTDPGGAFAFPILSLPVTTQYQVYVSDAPAIASPVLTVGAAVRVTTRVTRRRPRPRRLVVRFSGRIFPARDGVLVELQRRRSDGEWRTLARTIARHGGPGHSRYSRRVRVRRRGLWRVLVNSDGQYVSNVGRDVLVRLRARR